MSTETHHIDSNDEYGKKIGILAAVLAVLLSLFTINAHRAHTETIIAQNKSNDQWAFYQSKRIRDYQLQLNSDALQLTAMKNPNAAKLIASYNEKHKEYIKEMNEIKKEAIVKDQESAHMQKKASYYDFAEGVLEIALVMSSLYFISRKKFFPRIGLIFAVAGTLIGTTGLLL